MGIRLRVRRFRVELHAVERRAGHRGASSPAGPFRREASGRGCASCLRSPKPEPPVLVSRPVCQLPRRLCQALGELPRSVAAFPSIIAGMGFAKGSGTMLFMMRHRGLFATACCLPLVFVGCGGEDQKEGSGGEDSEAGASSQNSGGEAGRGGRGSAGQQMAGESGSPGGAGEQGGADVGGGSVGGRNVGGAGVGGSLGGTGQGGAGVGGAIGGSGQGGAGVGGAIGGSGQGGEGQGGTNGGEGQGGANGGQGQGGANGGQGQGGANGGQGAVAGDPNCPEPPSCNWCNGTPYSDRLDGCPTGWTCANGVDPCQVSPCESVADCGPSERCGDDGLCWPDPDICTVTSTEGGYVACEEGWNHRDVAVACVSLLPRSDFTCSLPDSGCMTDADCTAAPNGYCVSPSPQEPPSCECRYGCETDADCDEGSLCACRSDIGVGECVQASCRTDAECGEGVYCASHASMLCYSNGNYACQSPLDQCLSNDDCEGVQTCQLDSATGGRVCKSCVVP